MQGAPKKTSGRSYSLERPVARHFVCPFLMQAVCRPQMIQNKGVWVTRHGRNCLAARKDLLRLVRGKNPTTITVEKDSFGLGVFLYLRLLCLLHFSRTAAHLRYSMGKN